MIKNYTLKSYTQFLNEAGLDLGLDDAGGGEKKEKAPDPEEEIAKARKERRVKADKERNKVLDKAEDGLKVALKKTPADFNDKFEKRIMDALDKDDRVAYHDLIIDIQRFEIPKVKNHQEDEVLNIAPVTKILQGLNKNEYKG